MSNRPINIAKKRAFCSGAPLPILLAAAFLPALLAPAPTALAQNQAPDKSSKSAETDEASTRESEIPPTPTAATPLASVLPPAAVVKPGEARVFSVQHKPINELTTGPAQMPILIDPPDGVREVVVYVRRPGTTKAAAVKARRVDSGYAAELGEELVQPPGFDYWIIARGRDGTERAVFAGETTPHRVQVYDQPQQAHEREMLATYGGLRNQAVLSGEWVDFGKRTLRNSGRRPDDYYRLDASYAYSFFSTVEEIRFTYALVRGESAKLDASNDQYEDFKPGIDYGKARITWFVLDILRFRTSVLLGFSQEGFEYGGGLDMVIGNPLSANLALGVELIDTMGVTGKLRLGWLAAPRLPMGAGIEVTNFPSSDDTGVRLLYDVGYRFAYFAEATVFGGYQARTSVTGGPAAGAELVLRF